MLLLYFAKNSSNEKINSDTINRWNVHAKAGYCSKQ
jgi:hypothetical protein